MRPGLRLPAATPRGVVGGLVWPGGRDKGMVTGSVTCHHVHIMFLGARIYIYVLLICSLIFAEQVIHVGKENIVYGAYGIYRKLDELTVASSPHFDPWVLYI